MYPHNVDFQKFPRATAYLMGHADGLLGIDRDPERMLPSHRHREWIRQMDWWYGLGHDNGRIEMNAWVERVVYANFGGIQA